MTTTLTSPAIAPSGSWAIDPSHSSVSFSVKHMMIATVRGRFTDFSGTVHIAEDGSTAITGVVQASSIDTNEPQRDEHLRSEDFFEAATYPEIRFSSTSIDQTSEGYRIAGELTIKDVTRPVILDATVNGLGTDPWGQERLALEARGEINRKDFGLNWNQVLEAGGLLVGEKVTLVLDISTVKTVD